MNYNLILEVWLFGTGAYWVTCLPCLPVGRRQAGWCLEFGYGHVVTSGSLNVSIFFSSTRPSLLQPLFW